MDDNYIKLLRWGKSKPEGVRTVEFIEKLKELNFPYEGQGAQLVTLIYFIYNMPCFNTTRYNLGFAFYAVTLR